MPSRPCAFDKSQNQTPPANSPSDRQPKRVTSRVFPSPPMPSTETSRAPASNRCVSCISGSLRPTNLSRSAGRLWRISLTGSQKSLLLNHPVGFVGIRWGGEQDIAVRHLEQLHRLGDAFQAPVSVRADAYIGALRDGCARGRRQQRLSARCGCHHARGDRFGDTVDLQRLGAALDVGARSSRAAPPDRRAGPTRALRGGLNEPSTS